MGELLDMTWLLWMLSHLLDNCWVSPRLGFSWRPTRRSQCAAFSWTGIAWQLQHPLHPSPKSTSAEHTSCPRALPCIRTSHCIHTSCYIHTYHCHSAELLQRLLLLLLAAKTGAAIAELRAVESWLHSTSSAVIQPHLCPAGRMSVGFLHGEETFGTPHIPPVSGRREGSGSPGLSSPKLM